MTTVSLPPLPENVTKVFADLQQNAVVAAALKQAHDDEQLTLRDQIELTEIEAPPFHEEVRAKEFAERLKKLGLTSVRIDKEGNVIGIRPGIGNGPRLALAAHLDTVFPAGTDVKVRQEGTRYYAPGISDDARGLAVVLEVLRLLQDHKIETEGDIVFIGSVGEEGNGDLRGSKYLFSAKEEKIDGFISVDGVNINRVLCGSTGSIRYRAIYEGPGGHSWKCFGTPSAAHALGRAIAKIADVEVPAEPRTSFTVGTVQGGTTVNSIAARAEAEIDMRSMGNDALNDLVAKILPLLEEACKEENARWSAAPENEVKLTLVPIGHRPGGGQPEDTSVLLAARGAMDALSIPLLKYDYASTDQNVPISLGIPATTLGGGGDEGFNHNVKEWYDSTDSYLGSQLAFLTALALVGLKGTTKALLVSRE